MSHHDSRREDAAGRRYEPPTLTRIRLVPDEAVLASCKNSVTLGPSGFGRKCTGPPAMCSHNAS